MPPPPVKKAPVEGEEEAPARDVLVREGLDTLDLTSPRKDRDLVLQEEERAGSDKSSRPFQSRGSEPILSVEMACARGASSVEKRVIDVTELVVDVRDGVLTE